MDKFEIFKTIVQIEIFKGKNIISKDYQKTFGNFKPLLGDLSYQRFIILTDSKQLILMQTPNKFDLIVKRYIISCSKNIEDPFTSKGKVEESLQNIYKEYCLNKMIWAHPCSVGVHDLKITRLIDNEEVVTEFIMEYGGEDLSKSLKIFENNKEAILKVLLHTSHVLRFLENYKIIYSDVKLSNFVIDSKKNVRLIDFDVSDEKSLRYESIKYAQEVRGYTPGYAAPEIVKYAICNKMNLSSKIKYEPWKADLYSWGIMVLILLKGISLSQVNEQLDKWKSNENDHFNHITLLIDSIKVSNDEDLTEKMKLILKNCLSFNPDSRMTFKILNEVIVNIQNFEADNIISYIQINQGQNPFIHSTEEEKQQTEEIKSMKDQIEKLTKEKIGLEAKNMETSEIIQDLLNVKESNQKSVSSSKLPQPILQVESPHTDLSKTLKGNIKSASETIEELKKENSIIKKQLELSKSELNKQNTRIDKVFSETLDRLNKCKFNLNIKSIEDFPNLIEEVIFKTCAATIEKLLKNDNLKGPCCLCKKEENYSDMMKCINDCPDISNKVKEKLNKGTSSWGFLNANISTLEAKAIFSLLKVNGDICFLDVAFNMNINDDCGKILLNSIKNHSSLEDFYIFATKISGNIQLEIGRQAKSIKNLRKFCIDFEQIIESDASKLATEINAIVYSGSFNDKGQFLQSNKLLSEENDIITGINECYFFKIKQESQ